MKKQAKRAKKATRTPKHLQNDYTVKEAAHESSLLSYPTYSNTNTKNTCTPRFGVQKLYFLAPACHSDKKARQDGQVNASTDMPNNDTTNDDQPTQSEDIEEHNPGKEAKMNEKISQDHDAPFSPPEDIQDKIDDTQQEADVNVDPHEWHDEGIEEVAKTDPPDQTEVNEYDPFTPGTEAEGLQERVKKIDQDEEEGESA